MMNCESCREKLSELLAGELDAIHAAGVRQHLADCPSCARLLEAMRTTADMTDRLLDMDPPRALCLRIMAQTGDGFGPDLAAAPEIMTPEQLARFLQVPLAKLEDEIGALPSFEIAGELRFRKDRLLEWIEERERSRECDRVYTRLRAV